MPDEHFEVLAGWTFDQVRQWQTAAVAGPVLAAGSGLFDGEGRPLVVRLEVPLSAGEMVAALYGEHEHLMPADLDTDEEMWEHIAVVIVQDGLRRMVTNQEDVYYYITLMNENYEHPPMPPGVEEGIRRGLYRFAPAPEGPRRRATIIFSGTAQGAARVGVNPVLPGSCRAQCRWTPGCRSAARGTRRVRGTVARPSGRPPGCWPGYPT